MKATILDWKNPDYTEVYRERNARLDKIRAHDAWDAAFDYYRTRPIEAIEDWLFTYDPRNLAEGRSPYVPFVLMPHQKAYIRWLMDRWQNVESGAVEKSRDMGISWLAVAFAWWLWTFHTGSSVAFGSYKEDVVDKVGDPKSLFEKFRLLMRRLPDELIPKGYVEKKHATHLKISNPANESVIVGEGGDRMGRGGRSSIYFLDEFAFVERSLAVDGSVSQNSSVRIYQSTANGTGNAFFQKVHSGTHPVFRFHWTDDPRKDQAWYEKQCEELDPEVVAQEIDINYEASDNLIAISPAWIKSSQELYRILAGVELRKLVHRLEEESVPKIGGGDVAAGGSASNIFVIRWGPLLSRTSELKTDDLIDVAGWMKEQSEEQGVPITNYDPIGVGAGVVTMFKRWKKESRMKVKAVAVHVGKTPSNRVWSDGKRATDKFSNLKAEMWWSARDRLRKTHSHLAWMRGEGGKEHDLMDLLLIHPAENKLARELGVVKAKYLESGKIQIESKTSLKTRGIVSPDRADSVILTEAPKKKRFRVGRQTGIF